MQNGFQLQRDVVVVYTAQLVQVILSFVSGIFIARLLGSAGQGEWTLYQNSLSFFILLASFGVPAALVYFISSGKLSKEQLLGLLRTTLFFASLILIVLLVIHAVMLSDMLPSFFKGSSIWFGILFFHALMLIVQQIFISVLQSEKQFLKQSYIIIAGNALYLILIVLLSVFKPEQAIAYLIAAMLANLLLQLIVMGSVIRNHNPSYFKFSSLSGNTVKAMYTFGFLALLTNLLQFLNYKMDVWFLNYYFHDKSMIGVYAIAVSLAQMAWLFPQAIQSVIYQSIAEHQEKTDQWQVAFTQFKTIAIYCTLIALPALFLAQWVIPQFYGEEYNDAVILFQYLLLAVLPFCLTMPVSAYFSGTGRVRINLFSALIGFVVCLSANLYFIPHYEAMGAVLSSILSYAATTLFLLFVFFTDRF